MERDCDFVWSPHYLHLLSIMTRHLKKLAKTPLSQCRGLGLIPDQGTGSYLPWLGVQMPQLKDPTRHNQDPAQPNK